jgi:hypothetical protein
MNSPQPSNPHLCDAARALTGVLAHDGLDLSTCLAVGAALATLDDVQPPPPPLSEPIPALHPDLGIPAALAALRAGIGTATDRDEAMRAGLAAHELLALQDRS